MRQLWPSKWTTLASRKLRRYLRRRFEKSFVRCFLYALPSFVRPVFFWLLRRNARAQSRIEIGHPISYRKRYLIFNKELAHFVKQQEHEMCQNRHFTTIFPQKHFVDDSRRYFSEAKEKSRPECIVPSAEVGYPRMIPQVRVRSRNRYLYRILFL